jgi:hypothetical protein
VDKVTSKVKWPDPSDWVGRLYAELTERQTAYDAATEVRFKRNIAAAMLSQTVLALQELPPFRNNSG